MRIALIALAAVVASPASALSLVYNDFSNTSGLSLNGQAATAVDAQSRNVLRVTKTGGWSNGSVFSTTPVVLGADVSFSTRFTFNFNTPFNGGADGLVFVVQTNSNDVGSNGGGIGYQGIPNSVGIEFDNWDNGSGWGDPNDNHVGIDIGGNVASVVATPSPFTLDEGGDLTAWVDYNGATNLLEVRLANSLNRPAAALLSYTVDLVSVLGTPNAYVGFTSGTGSAGANHDVISWIFNDDYKPVVGGVPEPATWAMLIAGFGLVGAAARRRRALTA